MEKIPIQKTKKNLLNINHSGFQPEYFCENQLLSNLHNICAGFDKNPPFEVGSSQVIFLGYFIVFLSNGYKRVTIIDQNSDLLPILTSVPQGSVLGPLLCLISNNLPDALEVIAKLFAKKIIFQSLLLWLICQTIE